MYTLYRWRNFSWKGETSTLDVRRRIDVSPSISETDRAISEILGDSTARISKISPLAEECAKYIAYITTEIKEDKDQDDSYEESD